LYKHLQEIKLQESEFKKKYNFNINRNNQFESFSKDILKKYNVSIYEIVSSEEKDRKKIKEIFFKIRDEFNMLLIELKEITKESDIYADIIEKLEESHELKNEFKKLKILQQRVKEEPTITKRRAILLELKKDIECYEKRAFSLFMERSSSNIKEEIFKEEHKSQKLKIEINIIVEKLKLLEPNYQFKFNIKEDSSRLELIKDELKVAYAKIKKSKILKDRLLELISDIDNPDLNAKVSHLSLQTELTKAQYKEISNEIKLYKEQEKNREDSELIIDNVVGGLQELGYEIVDEDIEKLKNQKEVLIDIDQEYKLKVTLKDSSYKIRFIKHIFNDIEPSQNEKQRDMEIMTKWCGDYDRLLEILAQNGLAVEHKIKLEPDIDDIEYVVVESQEEGSIVKKSTIHYQSI